MSKSRKILEEVESLIKLRKTLYNESPIVYSREIIRLGNKIKILSQEAASVN
jgi:hypothetical protein